MKTQVLTQALNYLRYYFRAKTKYSIHSPFIFDFIKNVLEDERYYYAFDEIEFLRKGLLKNQNKVKITDYGAGSQISESKTRTIAEIAKYSATTPQYCKLLFKIVNHYKPEKILELGTSLGISTLYLAKAKTNQRIITIEGCPNIASLAKQNFRNFKTKNIVQLTGRFEEQLPAALKKLKTLDFVFIDGNHREEPTYEYFTKCLEFSHENSIFIFDDIHWSKGMEAAWEKIKAHKKVQLTIDLFFFGIVFFRKEIIKKEHFALIKAQKKPWRIGLFR